MQSEAIANHEDLAVEIVNQYVIGMRPGKRKLVESVSQFLAGGWAADDIRCAADQWERSGDAEPANVFGSEDGLRSHLDRAAPPEFALEARPQTHDDHVNQVIQVTHEAEVRRAAREEAAEGGTSDSLHEDSAYAKYDYVPDFSAPAREKAAMPLLRKAGFNERIARAAAEAIAFATPHILFDVAFEDGTVGPAFTLARRLAALSLIVSSDGSTIHFHELALADVADVWCAVWDDRLEHFDADDFAVNLVSGYQNVLFPAGEDGTFLSAVREAADLSPMPDCLKRFDRPALRHVLLLGKACRVLSAHHRQHGRDTFYLGCRAAGALIGKGKDYAWKLLGMLENARVIECVTLGARQSRGGDATVWRYTGDGGPASSSDASG